ncbi:hypothetical protein CQW23_00817 [Capsicum baccatum]|uniref:Myb-like domain-containing protein n=1 Tax=Capsicum baccatum TaxID=33114 RepID=A0A2G2XLT0_CAPBA|nr:hypothetical protein CQW23_00817 [Capsicum baccatum]
MMRGWEQEDDKKLLHLEKIMPQQWTIIAPVSGRTSSQCIERYDQLLENYDKWLPWEIDSHPDQSKPAPPDPDPINMDDDEKKKACTADSRL